MSHLKARKGNDCLNCNAVVHGRFCGVCGQENTEPAESAGHLVSHFFNDITHFDGKFFSSLKYLIFRPGFLSNEYKRGRRVNYLNPVRMYVFTSFIFFLFFFSVYHMDNLGFINNIDKPTNKVVDGMDSATFVKFAHSLDSTKLLSRQDAKELLTIRDSQSVKITDYKSHGQYDSLIKSGKVKDSWLVRLFAHKQIDIQKKYGHDRDKLFENFLGSFTHMFPQMLFVSLPLFALFLKILYWRRKSFYYVSHAIFSLHLYIFTFIVLLVIISLSKLHNVWHTGIISWLTGFLYVGIFFYLYKAMRNFYGQGRGKTILKFLLLDTYLFIVVSLIFLGFLLFSFLKV